MLLYNHQNHKPSQNEKNENVHEKSGSKNVAKTTIEKKNTNYQPANHATVETHSSLKKEIDASNLCAATETRREATCLDESHENSKARRPRRGGQDDE